MAIIEFWEQNSIFVSKLIFSMFQAINATCYYSSAFKKGVVLWVSKIKKKLMNLQDEIEIVVVIIPLVKLDISFLDSKNKTKQNFKKIF